MVTDGDVEWMRSGRASDGWCSEGGCEGSIFVPRDMAVDEGSSPYRPCDVEAKPSRHSFIH